MRDSALAEHVGLYTAIRTVGLWDIVPCLGASGHADPAWSISPEWSLVSLSTEVLWACLFVSLGSIGLYLRITVSLCIHPLGGLTPYLSSHARRYITQSARVS